MDDRAHSSLLVLLAEDRNEIRAARDKIVWYSATFTSAIITTIGASRDGTIPITDRSATFLACSFLSIYLVVASVQYIGLQKTRENLNWRETLLIGDDRSRDSVKIFYSRPSDYRLKNHLASNNGDIWYGAMILGVLCASVAVILLG